MEVDPDTIAFRVEEVSNRALAFLPLPWRVIFLIGLGILCWASNLHFLHLVGVDPALILDISSHVNSHYPRPLYPAPLHLDSATSTGSVRLYTTVYKLFAAYASWSFGCWLLFRALCGGDVQTMDQYKIVPEICIVVVFAALVCPLNVFRKRERDLFLHGLYRCMFCPMNKPVYFSDIVLADIFTSFAKIIGDLWISACMLAPWGSLRVLPVHEGWMQWLVPCLMSLPYIARLRQCLAEYLSSAQTLKKRALLNGIKYSTAFPVIFLSAAQRLVISELAQKGSHTVKTPWHGEHRLFRLWLLAVVVNSGYSFWWDVTNDWGLSLFRLDSEDPRPPALQHHLASQPQKSIPTPSTLPSSFHEVEVEVTNGTAQPPPSLPIRQHYPRGLRPVLLFNDPIVYYIAISLNLVFRLTWSLKLSSHLHSVADLEGGVFLMEALELIRRWVWVFFRIEWEAVKNDIESAMDDTPSRVTEELELMNGPSMAYPRV